MNTPYILTAAELAVFLAEKKDLVIGRASTREPSKYAELLTKAGVGGAFEVMKIQKDGRPLADETIAAEKQKVRNALAVLVEDGKMPPARVSFVNIRPDTPASEFVLAMVKAGAPAMRERKAKEAAAPASESAPA